MSTLFETYYDSLGHEMHIGDPVMGKTRGYFIYGHIINFRKDKNGNEKYIIVPDLGYRSNTPVELKKHYTIGWKNVLLVTIKRK